MILAIEVGRICEKTWPGHGGRGWVVSNVPILGFLVASAKGESDSSELIAQMRGPQASMPLPALRRCPRLLSVIRCVRCGCEEGRSRQVIKR